MKRVLEAAAVLIILGAFAPAGASASQAAASSFRAHAYQVRDLRLWARPYASSGILPRTDPGVHDRHGVRMRRTRGRLYDFPRGQATYGLRNLSSYLVTDDAFYLERALAQAKRLHSIRVVAGTAWYYPNRPSRHRHGKPGEYIAAPYYSALAQGRVLMFFSRLAEVTGDARWRAAADHTFTSFRRVGPRPGPYCVNIDARGYLWLQEWPWAGLRPDDTFNGHNSAAFGIYEYWHLTRDAEALRYFRGAATTAQRYAPDFRDPGWLSFYCRAHRDVNPFYHSYHVGQLLTLHRMTGAVEFARCADLFSADYPRPGLSGTMTIEPGRYVAVRFTRAGRAVARKKVTVRSTVIVRADRRERLSRGGRIYLRPAAGPLAGWWLAEHPGRVYADGSVTLRAYDPVCSVVLPAGHAFTLIRLDRQGRVSDPAVIAADASLTLTVDAGATVLGYPSLRIAEGGLARYWLRVEAGVGFR